MISCCVYGNKRLISSRKKGEIMIRLRYLITALTFISIAGWFSAIQAQRPYRLSEQDMKNLLERIEKGADRYRSSLKEALGESRFDDTKAEDNINQFVKNFEVATDRLQARFDDN
jgi:hypothetical protein